MPRRDSPDALSLAVGQRIRELRAEEGLTIQDLAEQSQIGSKGHLSSMERGLVRPNIETLKRIADGLGVLPLDLLTFPTKDVRQRLIDATRRLSLTRIGEVLRALVRGEVSEASGAKARKPVSESVCAAGAPAARRHGH